jgi:phosphate starvation-inducible PhoH-like protein
MKRMKTPPKRTTASTRRVKEKYIPEMTEEGGQQYVASMPRFEAKNANQKLALTYLNEGRPVVFLTGSAGTGKSMIAAFHTAKLLKAKKIEKVYLVRPAVSVGKSVGMLPGTVEEKLAPFFAQTLEHMGKFLGKGEMQYLTEKKVIEMVPVEYLRGRSFENCVVVAEEVQNFTAEEMEMCLTRLGEGCQFIFTGDTKQHDLRGVSGLATTLNLFKKVFDDAPDYLLDEDLDEMESGVGVVQFLPQDVLRSGLTRAFVKMYYHN